MTVAPGTEMRFASGRRLQVSTGAEEGTLVASGTPAMPIRMIADAGDLGRRPARRADSGGHRSAQRTGRGLQRNGHGGIRVDNPGNPGDRVAIVENCLVQSGEAGSVGVYLSATPGSARSRTTCSTSMNCPSTLRWAGLMTSWLVEHLRSAAARPR